MSKQKSAWGIEIGSSGLKAIKLVASETGADIENYAVVPYKQVLSAPDVDAGETVRLALQEFLAKNELEGSAVVASVGGAVGVARFATLPPVEPKRIPEIVKFEAVQQIPFPIEQAEWDYQIFQQADMPDVKVGVFAIAKERLVEYMANFNVANVRLEALTLSPLGVFNAFSYDHKLSESRKCTAYVDIGTMATDIIIVEDNVPWVRTFPIGGHHLTEALVKQLKISYARAEEEKIGLASSKMGKQMLQAMRGVVLDLATEIGRSINFYQQLNRGSEVKRIVGVGASFRLPGLVKFLSQNLPVEIERLEQFNRLEVAGRHGSRLIQHSLDLSAAYGLALQGLGMGRVEANLLPRQIMLDRLWKSKRMGFAGAAACVVAAAGVAGGVWMAQRQAAEDVIRNTTLSKINAEAEGYRKDLATLKNDDPRAMSETIVHTQAYRSLYPKILEDVSAAMASMGASEELLSETPDYAKIKALTAAHKNNRVRIRKVDLAYVPPKPKGGSALSDPSSSFAFASSSGSGAAFNPEICTPPRICVTVYCSTEMDSGETAAVIGRTLKPWLEKEKARLDAAYAKWDAAKKSADAAADEESRRELAKACPDRLYRIAIDNANQLFVQESTAGGAKPLPEGIAGAPFGAADGGFPPLSKLLPERPDMGARRVLDFKCTWDLVLAGPDVANMAAADALRKAAQPSASPASAPQK